MEHGAALSAVADARVRHSAELGPVQEANSTPRPASGKRVASRRFAKPAPHVASSVCVTTTAPEEKIEKLMELMDLKNLALEGMEAKVRKVRLPVTGARATAHALR